MKILYTIGFVGLALLHPAAAAAPDAQHAMEHVQNQWRDITGFSCTLEASLVLQAGQTRLPINVAGPLEYRAGKGLGTARAELAGTVSIDSGQGPTAMPHELLAVFDGRRAHMQTVLLWRKLALMLDVEEDVSGLKSIPDLFTAAFDAPPVLLPVETLRGQAVHAFEGAVQEEADAALRISRLQVFFRRADGAPLRATGRDSEGNQTLALNFRNVEVRTEAARPPFAYTAPEGYEVVDLAAGEPLPLWPAPQNAPERQPKRMRVIGEEHYTPPADKPRKQHQGGFVR